jgi:hypothetical protein
LSGLKSAKIFFSIEVRKHIRPCLSLSAHKQNNRVCSLHQLCTIILLLMLLVDVYNIDPAAGAVAVVQVKSQPE